MSLNNILKGVSSDVSELLRRSRSGDNYINLEDLRYRAHNLLNWREELSRLKEKQSNLNVSSQLITNDIFDHQSLLKALIEKTIEQIDQLQRLINDYESEKEFAVQNVSSQLRRAKQKISYLNALKGFYDWIHEEAFQSLEFLDSEESSSLSGVDLEANELTLPISNQEDIAIKEILIGRDTNCIIGDPSGGDNKTSNLLTEEESIDFTAYSINSSNAKLTLEIVFKQETIVNKMLIKISQKSSSPLNKIKDIKFINTSGEETSIKKLLGTSLQIDQVQNAIERSFIPVKAKKVSIEFVQTNPTYINSIKHYLISISYISFKSIRYNSSMSLSSKDISFGNYSNLSSIVDIFPKAAESYSVSMRILSNALNEPIEINGDPLLLDSSIDTVKYVLSLSRSESLDSLLLEDQTYYNYRLFADIYSPEDMYSRTFSEDYVKTKVKVAHEFKGTLQDSESTNPSLGFSLSDLGLEASEIIFKYRDSNSSIQEESLDINSNGTIDNPNQYKLLLQHAIVKPKIIDLYNNYFLEVNKSMDIGSYEVRKDLERISQSFKVWEKDNIVKGLLIEKSKLEVEDFETELSSIQLGSNSYQVDERSIIKNTLAFKNVDGLTLVESEYQNGSSEFSALSDFFLEALNSQIVSRGVVISFEPQYIISENETCSLYKGNVFINNAVFLDEVDINQLSFDTPTIDREENVVYIKTSEEDFFSNYYIKYKYSDISISSDTMFSVDYKNGIIYFNKSINENIKIFYSCVPNINVKHNIVKYLDYKYDGDEIQVYTETPITAYKRNRLKIYFPEISDSISLSDVQDYYSPIISKIKLGAV